MTKGLLDAILDRLVPAEAGPGAIAVKLGASLPGRVAGLEELLGRLAGFDGWTAEAQDDALRSLSESGDPAFAALVAAAHELYYSDPRAWAAIGYTTNLPGRP